jgi:hypothetical protein
MRNYGKISPQFWMGKTGKSLRREGVQAQMVALYLISSPHANLLGLYYLPLSYIAHDTGLSLEDAERGLQGCVVSGLCLYDDVSDMVWVLEMARFQVAESLSQRDKRIASVQHEYASLPANPFLPAFYERYGAAFLMAYARTADGERIPFGTNSEGLRSQEQEQEQEQKQEQVQEQENEQEPMRDAIAPHSRSRTSGSSDVAKPERQSHAKRVVKTPLPDNFGISENVRLWAEQRNIAHLDLHLEHFISTVRRNGYTYVDWDEALKVAIRKDWADLGKTSLAHAHGGGNAAPLSRLGKAGQATADNAKRWLEEAGASH